MYIYIYIYIAFGHTEETGKRTNSLLPGSPTEQSSSKLKLSRQRTQFGLSCVSAWQANANANRCSKCMCLV